MNMLVATSLLSKDFLLHQQTNIYFPRMTFYQLTWEFQNEVPQSELNSLQMTEWNWNINMNQSCFP